MEMEYYYIFLWGCVEPELTGPFPDKEMRDLDMGLVRSENGDDTNSYIPFEVTKGAKVEI